MSRPRQEVSDDEQHVIDNLRRENVRAQVDYREYCVMLLTVRHRSFAEVSKATGLSTNTLQRWKREAT